MTSRHLRELLSTVENWPHGSTNYPDSAWERLTAVAREVQRDSPTSVEIALFEYQHIGGDFQDSPGAYDDGKLLLLMRVVFDLPDASQKNQLHMFAGWVTLGTEFNADGTANVDWPLKWSNGRPYLVSGFIGVQGIGARYDAEAEYRYLLGKYKCRDLSRWGDQ